MRVPRHIGLLPLCAVLCALPLAVHAALTATVEPRVVDELDTMRLIIRTTGSNQAERLDLSALESDFEVLTTQSASEYRSVNGRAESSVEYQVLLRPLHAGDLTIPPIEVGGATTEPLAVRVRGMAPELRDAIGRMVFFETELTTNPVYVQSQTVLIRRLYYATGAQIYSDLPGMPQIDDAIVMPLGETTSTSALRDGQRYGVIEQRFAILPEQSGTLEVPAIAVTSSVRLQVDGRTRRSGVRVATRPLTLEVLPIPAAYPADEPWLPAESLTLQDVWEPAAPRMAVGDPLRRRLRARIRGNVSSAIPPLQPRLPEAHFRRYPEPPELEDDDSGSSVRGTREEAFSIIPIAPGAVHVPATEIVWWDVGAHAVRTARAPDRTVTITGAAIDISDAAPGETAAATATGSTTPPAEAPPEPGQPPWEKPADDNRMIWIALLLAALLGGLLARLLPGRSRPERPAASAAACRRALARACRSGEPRLVHERLLEYLRVHYQAPLGETVRRFRADGHAAVLDQVNAARYRNDGAATVDGAAVIDAVRALRRRRHPAGGGPLPALYDHGVDRS